MLKRLVDFVLRRSSSDLPLTLRTSVALGSPSPDEVDRGDPTKNAYFHLVNSTSHYLGLADTVGPVGASYGSFTPPRTNHALMRACEDVLLERLVDEDSSVHAVEPSSVLEEAHEQLSSQSRTRPSLPRGGATATLAFFDGDTGVLEASNLGDSGLVVLRPTKSGSYDVCYYTEVQQHDPQTPYQLSYAPAVGSRSDVSSDDPTMADRYVFELEEGDVVLVAPDAFFDHVFEEDICAVLDDFGQVAVAKGEIDVDGAAEVLLQTCVDNVASSRYYDEPPPPSPTDPSTSASSVLSGGIYGSSPSSVFSSSQSSSPPFYVRPPGVSPEEFTLVMSVVTREQRKSPEEDELLSSLESSDPEDELRLRAERAQRLKKKRRVRSRSDVEEEKELEAYLRRMQQKNAEKELMERKTAESIVSVIANPELIRERERKLQERQQQQQQETVKVEEAIVLDVGTDSDLDEIIIGVVTGNAMKFEELERLLLAHPVSTGIRYQQVDVDLMETQGTPEEITLMKCELAHGLTTASLEVDGIQIPFDAVIVEDSSLEIDSLEGFPGPYIKHFVQTVGHEGIPKLAKTFMEDGVQSTANAISVMAMMWCGDSNGESKDSVVSRIVVRGEANVEIVDQPQGETGVFEWDDYFAIGDRTFAQMSHEEKDLCSQRGMAVRKLLDGVLSYGGFRKMMGKV